VYRRIELAEPLLTCAAHGLLRSLVGAGIYLPILYRYVYIHSAYRYRQIYRYRYVYRSTELAEPLLTYAAHGALQSLVGAGIYLPILYRYVYIHSAYRYRQI